MEKKNDIFGKRMKILRDKKGLNQEDIANEIGISRASYSHYETNRVEPDLNIIRKLSDYHNVTTDYLLGKSDQPHLTEEESFEAFKNDPSLERWYKELPKSDEEDLRRLKRIWEAFREDK